MYMALLKSTPKPNKIALANDKKYSSYFLSCLKIPIILGGIHVSSLPKLSLKQCKAKYVIIGEDEQRILELMDKWDTESFLRKKFIVMIYSNFFSA